MGCFSGSEDLDITDFHPIFKENFSKQGIVEILIIPKGSFCPKCINYAEANGRLFEERGLLLVYATERPSENSDALEIDIRKYAEFNEGYHNPTIFKQDEKGKWIKKNELSGAKDFYALLE